MIRPRRPARARLAVESALRAVLVLVSACGGSAPPAALPVEARPGAEQRPPRVASGKPWSFPRLARGRLDNGLELQLLRRPGAPLLELRLVVRSGTASDDGRPGVAALTAAALQPSAPGRSASRDLAERAENLGARWQLETTRDATLVSVSLPGAALAEGLALLGSFTTPPRPGAQEFEQLRRRELARVNELLVDDPSWAASMALYAELFRGGPRHHPYERFDTLPGDLERSNAEDCSAWYARNFSPENSFLVVVGDLTLEQVLPLAQRALAGWQGSEVTPPVFFTPPGPRRAHTLLVDRAPAAEVELRVATLGPERKAPGWAQLALLAELLESSRTQLALQRSGEPDPHLGVRLEEVAHGATPLLLSARVALESAPRALGALLDAFSASAADAPLERALHGAIEQLSARPLLGLETGAGTADLLSGLGIGALREGAFDDFRAELARTGARELHAAALRYSSAPPTVVVVGDAERLVTPLSHFGQVHVLNAARGFQVERVVSQDSSAELDVAPAGP